jgi:cytochrome P450
MLYIITSHRVYTTLQHEIDVASQQNRLSLPIVQDSEARLLPYLQAVIKEGMRIHPPATGLVAKKVPLNGDEINGVKLPSGTKIGVNMWALLRDPKVFGNDAENFRPERWLEASGEKLKEMERQQELVWGYGKYVCIGRNVALTELNKIFVEVSLAVSEEERRLEHHC